MISPACELSQIPQVSSVLTRRGDVAPAARPLHGDATGLRGRAMHALSLCSYLDRTGAWRAVATLGLRLRQRLPAGPLASSSCVEASCKSVPPCR